MTYRWFLFFAIFCVAALSASSEEYEKPNTASDEAWEAVQPYLLPADSYVRKILDDLFSSSRITSDRESLEEAGFVLTPHQGLHVIVASHGFLNGFLVKVIVDKYNFHAEGLGEDWEQWIRRIEGEKLIREAIVRLGYKKYFKVPRQWIYPLPNGPEIHELKNYYPKSFVLVTEDMQLAPSEKNTKFYRHLSKSLMKAIFTITTELGLSDCCNKYNVPLCKDDKLAFIDTETFHQWPVDYHRMIEFLSPDRRKYWEKLRKEQDSK